MKKIKTIFSLILASTLALSLASCGKGDSSAANSAGADKSSVVYRTLDEIKSSGKVNIGVFSDKNPFGYVDENGEYQGYDVYFARRIGQDLGVEVNFVSTEAANRVEYLETGKVDIVLANFTVTDERAEKVDFALPYMNVALGVVSPDSRVITDLSQLGEDDEVIVISGTTAEDYLIKNNPGIKLQKYDTYANAKNALENGNAAAWANDNTEVIAYALQNPGYTVGIPSLGSQDTIAPAVSKGNETLLNWINDEIKSLASENFFHKDYEETLKDTYGTEYEESLVVEGGVTSASDSTPDDSSTTESVTLTVGASSTPHAEILELVKPKLAEQGIDLDIVIYDDYVLPNTALQDGTLDANYFQHTPYLNSFNESNGTDLVSAGSIHYEPFGIYSFSVTDLKDLAKGATIIVPDDDSNQTRALLLLAQEGLIKLPDDASVESGVTVLDIEDDNGYNIQAAQADAIPSLLKNSGEGTIAVINYNYALGAGLKTTDALAIEDASGDAAQTYANIVAVRNGDENDPAIQALVAALKDETVAKDTLEKLKIDRLDGYSNSFVFGRDEERMKTFAYEHTGYYKGSLTVKALDQAGIRKKLKKEKNKPVFPFREEAQAVSKTKCTKCKAVFSAEYFSDFTYNAKEDVYYKSHNGSPHIDSSNGKQLAFENVFILGTTTQIINQSNLLISLDWHGGDGYYISHGTITPIKWSKADEFADIVITDQNGSAIEVNPGKSYLGFTSRLSDTIYS